jgi:cyclic pyranopterin phosphate synthase
VETGLNVRFIEYMPFAGNGWSEARLMPYAEMREVIEPRYRLVPVEGNESVHGPAKEFSIAGTDATVGFITTMTEHFCASCNRLRLMADGRMLNCLFEQGGIDLRRLLRCGAGRSVIEHSIRASLLLKWGRHPDGEELRTEVSTAMVGIGG